MIRNRMRSDREGISLVEVIVTMVLLSIVLMALAPVLFAGVERQRTDAIRLERTGVLLSEANRLMAMPVGSLASDSIRISPSDAHHYDVISTVTGTNPMTVVVIVKPKGTALATGVGPDSVKFARTQ